MAILRTESDLDVSKIEGLTDDTVIDVTVMHVSNLFDTSLTMISYPGIIKFGDAFTLSGVSGWYCAKTSLEYFNSDATSKLWIQNIVISRVKPKKKEDEPNPLLRGVRRMRGTINYESQPAICDSTGRAVVNKAGDWMDGFSIQVPITEFHYEGNFATIPDFVLLANGAINSNAFTVAGLPIAPYCAKFLCQEFPLDGNITTENGIDFYPLFWRLIIDPRTHLEHMLNRGFHQFKHVDINGNLVSPLATEGSDPGQLHKIVKTRILDDKGENIADPQFLDSYGRHIKNVAPVDTAFGECTCFEGVSDIVLNSGTFDESDKGLFVMIRESGRGAGFYSTIESVDGVTATLIGKLPFTSEEAVLYKPGISSLTFINCPIIDFVAAGIPL